MCLCVGGLGGVGLLRPDAQLPPEPHPLDPILAIGGTFVALVHTQGGHRHHNASFILLPKY